MSRQVNETTRLLKDAGWRLVRVNRHRVWRCPCGEHTFVANTSSSGGPHGASEGARSVLRRCPTSELCPAVDHVTGDRCALPAGHVLTPRPDDGDGYPVTADGHRWNAGE